MEQPQISVIIPIYNVARYLPRCLDSLLAQTFKDFELILVDDGSKDDSGNICDHYGEMDQRIRVIHQPNAGTMIARRNGYTIAKGKYLIFCDSDDTMPPQAFDILGKAIMEQQVDVLFGAHTQRYDNGRSCLAIPRLPQNKIGPEMQKSMLQHEVFCTLWGNIYNRKLFVEYTYHIPLSLLHEDRLFLIQLIHNSRTFGSVDQSVYNYYQNESSITRNRLTNEKLYGSLAACEWQLEYMENQGICVKESKIFYLKYMNWLLENGYSKKIVVNYSSTSSVLYEIKGYRDILSPLYTLHTWALKSIWGYRLCCHLGRNLLKYYRENIA